MRKIICDWCGKDIGYEDDGWYKDRLYNNEYDLCNKCKDKYVRIWDEMSIFENKEKEKYEKELKKKRNAELKKLFEKEGIEHENNQ